MRMEKWELQTKNKENFVVQFLVSCILVSLEKSSNTSDVCFSSLIQMKFPRILQAFLLIISKLQRIVAIKHHDGKRHIWI